MKVLYEKGRYRIVDYGSYFAISYRRWVNDPWSDMDVWNRDAFGLMKCLKALGLLK